MNYQKIGSLSTLGSSEKISSISWNTPLLGKEEEFNLFEKYKKYKDKLAYNKIINSHLRIIYKIISKYKSLTKFEQDDLFSHGYIGLAYAIDKYDYKNTKARFCSYCPLWIIGEIKNYIFENESIVKQSKSSEFKKISYALKRLIKNSLNEVREDELKTLSLKLGISYKKILEVFKTIYFKDVSWDPVKDEDDLWNYHSYNPFNDFENFNQSETLLKKINKIVKNLNTREQKLFNLRFFKEKKLKEISSLLGISIEGARQMEERCLGKIKYQLSESHII